MNNADVKENCGENEFFRDKDLYSQQVEKVYHIVRGIFVLLIDVWLSFATFKTFSLIKKYSQKSLFTAELRKIFISYLCFVVIYLGWIV